MRQKRLLWRLIPTYLLITLGALLLVGWLATITVHRFYIKNKKADLEIRAKLVKTVLTDNLTSSRHSDLDSLSEGLSKVSLTRITIIDNKGNVLGDSEKDPVEMENHADRPEYKAAVSGQIGISTRFSTTLKQWMMYLAVPFKPDPEKAGGVVRLSIPLATIKDALARVYSGIALGGLLAIILAALFSYIVSRRISNPLVNMKQGAQRFAAGELTHRLTSSRVEELNELSSALNKMAVDLEERIGTITKQRNELEAVLSSMVEGVFAVDMKERLLKMNLSAQQLLGIETAEWQDRTLTEAVRNPELLRFVSEVLNNHQTKEGEIVFGSDRFLQVHGTLLFDEEDHEFGALIVMNDITRLRKLENIRREFAANVSHELRTPITSIKGFVETLQDGAIEDKASAERFLDIIHKHTDRLNAIIEDMLSLARIEQDAENDRIKPASVTIREIVMSAANQITPKASEKGITIEVVCQDEIQTRIVPHLLERATVNLLDNAVNYSETGTVVRVEVEKQPSEIIISVKDSGCGISSEHLPRLFERFYRVDPDRSRTMGGTGLGLAIVKHIALAHKGYVSVDSQPGEGSSFRIHLPVVA